MSAFTTRYTEPANISATIIQATTIADLRRLCRTNASVFAKNPHLMKEVQTKEQEIRALELELAAG